MSFEINGANGYYDGKVSNDSEKYGRNSVANHIEFVMTPLKSAMENEAPMLNFMPNIGTIDENIGKAEVFANKNDEYLNSLPPLEYEYRYMPGGNFDKDALFAAAKEEMGADNITVEDFEKNYLPNKDYTASALDINKDGKIDIPEYSASVLAADILSKDEPDVSKIDGSMNAKGMEVVMAYAKKSNSDAAVKLYSQIHSTYNLSLNA
ncbi:MAG: hypothetical protein MJ230_04170 [bacterium]|nr:hypothetical protein [bacterium]